jgi:hypothetical protein
VNSFFTPFTDKGNTGIAEHLREQGFATATILFATRPGKRTAGTVGQNI